MRDSINAGKSKTTRIPKPSILIAAAEKIGSRPKVFPPTRLVVPAIERICMDWGDVQPAVTDQRSAVSAAAQRGSSPATVRLASRGEASLQLCRLH